MRCLEKTPRSAGTVSPRPVPAPHENPTESFSRPGLIRCGAIPRSARSLPHIGIVQRASKSFQENPAGVGQANGGVPRCP